MSLNTRSKRTLVISDAHVSRHNGNVEAFFEMLESLRSFQGDIVFLGDIFDLWVGWSRYQEKYHLDFLDWCRCEKELRQVGMVEGNHEFYICRNFGGVFSWCTTQSIQVHDIWFEHGDLINYHDRNYKNFRRLTKNPVTCQLFRVLPWGPKLVQRLKKGLESANLAYKEKMPETEIVENVKKVSDSDCLEKERPDIKRVVFGHFHKKRVWTLGSGVETVAMPAWLDSGELGLFEVGNPVKFLHWRDV